MALGLGAALAALWLRTRAAAGATRPIADTLQRIESQIRDFESQRQHMLGGLEHQLSSLSRETIALSQALRAPNTRGRWGELTLRRVAELAGMVPYCDFFEQETNDHQRPDMIVKLPGGRTSPWTRKFLWRPTWTPRPRPMTPPAAPRSTAMRSR